MTEPKSAWDNDGLNPGVVWMSRLDERFLCEVVRAEEPYQGYLRVFDKEKNFECLLEEPVGLSYDAQLGPDVGDIQEWQSKIIDFVDNKLVI